MRYTFYGPLVAINFVIKKTYINARGLALMRFTEAG